MIDIIDLNINCEFQNAYSRKYRDRRSKKVIIQNKKKPKTL